MAGMSDNKNLVTGPERMTEEEAKKDALDAQSRLEWWEMHIEGRDYCGNKLPTKQKGKGQCGTVVVVPPRVVTLVQALLAPTLHVSESPEPVPIPATVRAHAFTVVGKMCLVSLARRRLVDRPIDRLTD